MTGLGRVTPASGARFDLTLTSSDTQSACYACEVRHDGSVYHGHADVSAAGVHLSGFAESPEWTQTFVSNLLRTVARAATDGRWPRRLTRWRSESTRSQRATNT